MTVTGVLAQTRLRRSYLHATSLACIGLCTGLWIRAKTVDQEERGNAERRALFVGLWPPMFWEMACLLASQYEFADDRILRAVYRSDQDLLGRNMLLEGRFYGLRFYFGVRVTGVFDETRDTERGKERVWGWSYDTLQGHLEQGRISFEVIKNLTTGQVAFGVAGYSRQARIRRPVVRLGFRVFGRWMQTRYYDAVQRRLYHLVQAAERGEPLPEPAVQADGLVLAPAGTRPHPLDWLAISWVQPGP